MTGVFFFGFAPLLAVAGQHYNHALGSRSILQSRVDFIGNERSPVVVIEDLWARPHELVDLAAEDRNDK